MQLAQKPLKASTELSVGEAEACVKWEAMLARNASDGGRAAVTNRLLLCPLPGKTLTTEASAG